MNRPLSELSDRLLLVEGPDDQHVVRHLWERRHGRGLPFQIPLRGGIEGVIESIRDEARALGRQALGILVDANDSPATRWQAVSDRLASVGIQTPAAPHPNGTVIDATDDTPRIGIWLMPNNQSPGELEDFVAQMIPDNDPVWPLSQDYIGRIPEEHREFNENKTSTAEVYAWLATREDPRQMGAAIGARDLDIGGDLCTSFTDWLDRLFV